MLPILALAKPLLGVVAGWLGPVKWIALALVAGLAVGYVKGCTDQQEKHDRFVGGVEALGRQAELDLSDAIKEGIARQEKANADYQAEHNRTHTLARQLRDERAHSRALSAAAAAAAGSPRASVNRADVFGAVGRLDAGLSELAEQADGERTALNTAKKWAQDETD